MPVVLHAHICYEYTWKCIILDKRHCDKWAYIIHAEIRDDIFILVEALCNLWCGNALRIVYHDITYALYNLICHITARIIIKHLWLLRVQIYDQRTVKTEMIDEIAHGIFNHGVLLLVIDIDNGLPYGNKLHLTLWALIILFEPMLLYKHINLPLIDMAITQWL